MTARFTATVAIQVEADNDADASDTIHSLLEPAEQEGHIKNWKYTSGPTEEPALTFPDDTPTGSFSFDEGKWGGWVLIGTVGDGEQKIRRPLDETAQRSLPQLAIIALALHDRIAALEKASSFPSVSL